MRKSEKEEAPLGSCTVTSSLWSEITNDHNDFQNIGNLKNNTAIKRSLTRLTVCLSIQCKRRNEL